MVPRFSNLIGRSPPDVDLLSAVDGVDASLFGYGLVIVDRYQ